jgi:hypothetical protein
VEKKGATSLICITIIDTIILTYYTNNAYLFDTGGEEGSDLGEEEHRGSHDTGPTA